MYLHQHNLSWYNVITLAQCNYVTLQPVKSMFGVQVY